MKMAKPASRKFLHYKLSDLEDRWTEEEFLLLRGDWLFKDLYNSS